MSEQSNARGWIVTFSGTAVNLCLGVLYTWSIIGKALRDQWHWKADEATLPYSLACGVFAIMMVFAGRLQDKIGPRIVASIGGILVGAGMIISSIASEGVHWPMVIGFGVLVGSGIGFGYGSTSPPAIKWFPPYKKGLIMGLVVAGFGCASVYTAPLTTTLLKAVQIKSTFLYLGIGFFVAIMLFSQLLKNPPTGYIPPGMPAVGSSKHQVVGHQYDWYEMLKTPQFYLLWLMYACFAFAGLMFISSAKSMIAKQLPLATPAYIAAFGSIVVALTAIGNAGGRILAGFSSDKLGRTRTLLIAGLGQATIMFTFKFFNSPGLLIMGAMLIGAFYGANLSLFPSATADYYGNKNFGVNNGLVFTAWGIGGVFGGIVAGKIFERFGSYDLVFLIAAVLCLVGSSMTFITKPPKTITVTKDISV